MTVPEFMDRSKVAELYISLFDECAKGAYSLAEKYSREVHSCLVGTDALLLGIAETSPELIRCHGASYSRVLEAVETPASQQMTLILTQLGANVSKPEPSPRCVEAMRHAYRIGEKQGCDYIGTDHLLQGLLAIPGSSASLILKQLLEE